MIRSMRSRTPVGLALILCCCGVAAAQDTVIFSLTSSATAGFGTLDSNEIACYDPTTQVTRPWFMKASSAFYAGDVTGDGLTDEWKNVDAIYVSTDAVNRVNEVLVSFNTSFGPFLDGDIVRLSTTGTLEKAYSEAQIIAVFGLTDGNCDVDGLHVGPDGRIYLSFSDDEKSSVLSTDSAGVITDGSIVSWNPATNVVAVEYTEGQIDAFVSNALGKSTKTGDTLGIAMDSNGVLCFSVQSPSSDDASVFAVDGGGRYVRRESELGLSGSVEIDALDLQPVDIPFLASRATPREVTAGQTISFEVNGAPASHPFVLLLSTLRGDVTAYPFDGFNGGLALDPTDPLFVTAYAGLDWLFSTTDASGYGHFDFPAAPAGVVLTVLAQPYDFQTNTVGTPIALEFEG